LDEYVTLLESKVPGFVTGLYLHGSLALGAFNERLSDIDFVALLSRRATSADIEHLRAIHRQIAANYPKRLLEGSYLQWDELGKLEEELSPAPFHHDNQFDGSGNFDINSVTWWVLKHRGIGLIGPQPHKLAFEVDWELLVTRMRQNLNSYWVNYVRRPRGITWLLTDFGVEWTVLGVLRQYYTFVAHDITSKSGAGEYALEHLPYKWHRIIREALHIREDKGTSLYGSRLMRAGEAYNFLRYLIEYCNRLPA
jgi:hypothetical protein